MPWTKRIGCLDVSASAAGAADSNNAPPARAARSKRGTARPKILAGHVVRIRMPMCSPLLVTQVGAVLVLPARACDGREAWGLSPTGRRGSANVRVEVG